MLAATRIPDRVLIRWTSVFLFLFALIAFASPARAVMIQAQTVEGDMTPDDKLVQLFQDQEIAIYNQTAAIKTGYQFRNDFDRDLELTVLFAMSDDEMIDSFCYWNGEEKIVGEVLEKQTAEQVYQHITGVQRRDPGLFERVGNSFRFRVFPVLPGEVKPVEVRSVTTLEIHEGVVEVVIPRDNLPKPGAVFSVSADITDDLPITEVETIGFHGKIQRFGDHHVRVVYESAFTASDSDWRIRYKLDSRDFGLRLVTHREPGTDGSFMLLVSPRAGAVRKDAIGRDLVFVIDISGSMQGEPLEQTKRALQFILRKLDPGDRFNVVVFDDKAEAYYPSLLPASVANVSDAVTRTGALQSRGGTNILTALQMGLNHLSAITAKRSRAIIFLTDGQGSEPPEQVIAEVRRRDTGVRIYSFGAGNGVNRPFLDRLARDNRGIATFIDRPQDIEDRMMRLYERVSMPLLVDLELEFDGLAVDSVYPTKLPDLYRDSQVVVYGRFAEAGKGTIRLRGTSANRKEAISLRVNLPEDEPEHAYVEKLWAGERIEQLMDAIRTRGGDEFVQEVTRLGIVYNIVTDYTTFLAVPESMKTAEIKNAIKQGKLGYDKKIIDSLDAVKLSQTHIPPGDPVLTVVAPKNARRVVAYFPFGLVKRLRWDNVRERWAVRFLVPRDVTDGVHVIRIEITHADGHVEWREVDYVIDAVAPEFDVDAPDSAYPSEEWPIAVDPFEPVASVEAFIVGGEGTRVRLALDADTGLYVGRIKMPEAFDNGRVTVHVVVRDLARNRFERDIVIRDETLREQEEETDSLTAVEAPESPTPVGWSGPLAWLVLTIVGTTAAVGIVMRR